MEYIDDKKAYIDFLEIFKKYQYIINYLLENQDNDGLCRISQKQISVKLEVSQSLVSKCIKRLERSDKCVEKISPGVYKVNHNNIVKFGPLSKVFKYCIANDINENIYRMEYEEQAKLLNMTVEEIKMVKGYIGHYYAFNNYGRTKE